MKHKWLTFFVMVGLLMTSSGTVLAQEPLPPVDPATLSKSALAIPKTGSINPADVSSLGASSTIVNGDFEQGSGVGWVESSSSNYPLVVDSATLPITPRGSWAVWLGGADNETSVISQSNISISSPAYLHLSYWIGSNDICDYDFGTIKINTTTLQTLDLCSSSNTNGWVDLSFDLSAYNGQTVTLSISAITDASEVSNFFIDDVYIDGIINNQTLTVSKNGTGSGTVTSNPSGINCGSTCSYSFANNASVTLTASAVSGSTFTGWSGAGCSGTGACIVTMNASQSVTATFTQVSTNWGLSATQVDNDVDYITLSIQGGSPPQSHWYNPNGIEVSPTCGFGIINEGIFVQGIYVGRKDYFYINGCNRMPGQYRVQAGTTIDLTFSINAIAAAPGAFNKTGPSSGSAGSTSPTLSWSASSGAASYEYCIDTTNDDACSGWISAGTGTAKIPAGLSPSTTYYWQVRAINADGTTYADGSGTDYWSFVTASGASLCAVGTHSNIVFNDNLESGPANWSFVNGAYTRWQYDSPYGLASHSGAHFLYANDSPAAITDATASLVPIAIPANGYLLFYHKYSFEYGTTTTGGSTLFNFDGGLLEYSNNGGANWTDAGALIDSNGYGGTIYPNFGNPLRNRSAFVKSSNGYIGTRLNLSSLAGQSVAFRWRMGLDRDRSSGGWSLDDVQVYNCISTWNISGNVGTSGVTLNYMDGTAKTAISQADGSYTLAVSNNWSGTVTPTHQCLSFAPPNHSYSNVSSNYTGENYTGTVIPTSGCTNIVVTIGVNRVGSYALVSGEEKRDYYPVSGGPVKVASQDGTKIVSAIRLQSMTPTGTLYSFVETMGVPKELISDKYYFPTYNNTWAPLNSQIRFANLGTAPTDVTVTIGTSFTKTYTNVPAQGEIRDYYSVSGGPVIVEGKYTTDKIIAAIRLQSMDASGNLYSFAETMGVPFELLSDTYYFPTYNNTWAPLNSQIRFANLGTVPTDIQVTIGGTVVGTYNNVPAQGEIRDYYNVSGGPVKVESLDGTKIIAAIRLQSMSATGTLYSFIETMGVPKELVTDKYYFPTYNNTWTPLNSQVRFANLGTLPTDIRVTIGKDFTKTYTNVPAQGEIRDYYNVSGGPVIVESLDGTKITAAIRLQSMSTSGILYSFAETMGVPKQLLSDTYYFPTYNNTWAPLNSQLRFGIP